MPSPLPHQEAKKGPTSQEAKAAEQAQRQLEQALMQRRLNIIRGPDNIARVLRAPMQRLMDLVELYMHGTPLEDGAEPEPLPENDAASFDMGSDKVPDIW